MAASKQSQKGCHSSGSPLKTGNSSLGRRTVNCQSTWCVGSCSWGCAWLPKLLLLLGSAKSWCALLLVTLTWSALVAGVRFCCVSWLPLVPLTIGELLGRRVLFPSSVCVGAAGDVGEGELVAKVRKISAIFADSDACKSADSNTASSIFSSSSVAVRILSSISWNRTAFDSNCFERSARRTASVGDNFESGLDSCAWEFLRYLFDGTEEFAQMSLVSTTRTNQLLEIHSVFFLHSIRNVEKLDSTATGSGAGRTWLARYTRIQFITQLNVTTLQPLSNAHCYIITY